MELPKIEGQLSLFNLQLSINRWNIFIVLCNWDLFLDCWECQKVGWDSCEVSLVMTSVMDCSVSRVTAVVLMCAGLSHVVLTFQRVGEVCFPLHLPLTGCCCHPVTTDFLCSEITGLVLISSWDGHFRAVVWEAPCFSTLHALSSELQGSRNWTSGFNRIHVRWCWRPEKMLKNKSQILF